MGIAYEEGLAGEGKFWLISGTADLSPYILSGNFVVPRGEWLTFMDHLFIHCQKIVPTPLYLYVGSSAAKAISGNGIFFCKGGLPGVGGSYDRFTQEWQRVGQNFESLEYINKKQPSLQTGYTNCTQPGDFFVDSLPHHIVTFTYDAVVSLGLSACGAQKAMGSDGEEVFTGKMHRDFFAKKTFRGASGDFILRDDFPTRTAESSYFVMVNMADNILNSTHISFKGSPLAFFWETNNLTWEKRGEMQFKYPGGGTVAPEEFEVRHEENAKEKIVWLPLSIALAMSALAFISAVIYIKRRQKQELESIWNVNIDELSFDDPPEVIGTGTFGFVLLAGYRGTEVAVSILNVIC